MKNYNCLVVLGPTASGKTHLACKLAHTLNGEIISADSRQVYRHLNIGTGKDLDEYLVSGKKIPYHLIDVCEPSQQFYLHDFIAAARQAFDDISARGRLPVICGGTGLYLDSFRKDFSLTSVAENQDLRNILDLLSNEALQERLMKFPKNLTAHVDLSSRKRLIRGIEVASFLSENPVPGKTELPYKPYYLGIHTNIETRKAGISLRLQQRLNAGLIDEVQGLLNMGVSEERLQLFGLEYKFVLQYLQNKITREELFTRLETAIFQFAKRQMTWFRKMEKEGVPIHWCSINETERLLTALPFHI